MFKQDIVEYDISHDFIHEYYPPYGLIYIVIDLS